MKRTNILILFISLFAFIMVIGGISYAYFTYNKNVATLDISSGEININFTSGNNNLSLSNVTSMSDSQGVISPNYLDFSVTGTADIEAILYELEIVSSNTSLNDYIKIYLTDQNNVEILSPFLYTELYDSMNNNGKSLLQDLVEGNLDGTSKTTTSNYRLRVWIDESYTDTIAQNLTVSVYLYAENVDTTNLEMVTFNTNDGRGHGPVKYVTLGETYGVMPTPVRVGYNFLGWNGKNLFNKDDIDDGHYIVSSTGDISSYTGSNQLDDWASTQLIKVKPSTAYVKSGNIGGKTTDFFDGNGNIISFNSININTSFTTAVNCMYVKFNLKRTSSPYDSVQLEEGSIATSYEPYYVTSSVNVTEWNTLMVLKAIWQENS